MDATHHKTYFGAVGAGDCHSHVYEDKYPLIPNRAVVPPYSPVSAYREVQQAIGTERAMVGQPMGDGLDNSCTLSAPGIAVIAPESCWWASNWPHLGRNPAPSSVAMYALSLEDVFMAGCAPDGASVRIADRRV